MIVSIRCPRSLLIPLVCCVAQIGGCSRPAAWERPEGARSSPVGTTDYRRELDISDRITAIGSSANGGVALGTLSGGLYSARRVEGEWREVVDSNKPRGHRFYRSNRLLPGEPLGIAFADERHGMVWGSLSDRLPADTAVVYTTSDGGARWTRRAVGRGYQFSRAELQPSGDFWIAGYDMYPADKRKNTVIYHSRDFGATWRLVSTVDGLGAVSGFGMDDEGTGILATVFNRLFLTNDSGRTWRPIPTPADRYFPERALQAGAGIVRAQRLRGWLVVQQGAGLYRSRADSIVWQEMDAGHWRFLTVDRARNGWCFLDAASRLREADSAWRTSEPLTDPPLARMLHVECKNRTLTGVDAKGRVYQSHGGVLVHGWPLTATDAVRPMAMERVTHGAHWGATDHGLYGTEDRGRQWFRYPFDGSTIRGFLPRSAEEVLIWDGHGVNTRFSRRTRIATNVATLRGYDLVDIVVANSVWIAYGGRQHENSDRRSVAAFFDADPFAGSRDHGFLMLSRDAGATWQEIDVWRDNGVASIAVNADASRIMLVSYLGSIREVRWHDGAFRGTTLLTAALPAQRGAPTRITADGMTAPYVENVTAFHFVDADSGLITGTLGDLRRQSYRTSDGGRTWTPIDTGTFGYNGLLRSGAQLLAWDRHTLYALHGSSSRPLLRIVSSAPELDERIIWVTRLGDQQLIAQIFSERTSETVRVLVDLRRRSVIRLDSAIPSRGIH